MAVGFKDGCLVGVFSKLMESKAIGKGESTGTSVGSHNLHISRCIFEQLQ